MKKGMKKIVSVLLCAAVFLSLTGCAPAPEQQDADAVRIALLCREDMDYNVSRYQKGMEMAIEEYAGPYEASVEVYGLDASDFESSVEEAARLAEDPDITAVVTMQDYEVINAAAKTMDDADKAFFAVQGYYDETAEAGYDTFFPFSLNAEHLSCAMGLYAVRQGLRRIGCIYSGAEFERVQVNEFERAGIMNGTQTVGSLSEPFNTSAFYEELAVWEALGAEAAYVPYYRSAWGAEILAAIKAEMPEIRLLSCFTLGSQTAVDYLAELDGTVMPAFYPVERSDEYREWAARYEERYGETPDNEAVQGYDLANLILSNYSGDNKTLAEAIRANAENAAGIAGNTVRDLLTGLPEVSYDEADAYGYEYLTVQDGRLVHTEP